MHKGWGEVSGAVRSSGTRDRTETAWSGSSNSRRRSRHCWLTGPSETGVTGQEQTLNRNLTDWLRVKLMWSPRLSIWRLVSFLIIFTPPKCFSAQKKWKLPFQRRVEDIVWNNFLWLLEFQPRYVNSGWISLNVACTDIFAKQYFAPLVKWKEQIQLKFIFYFLSLPNLTLLLAEIRYRKGLNIIKLFLQFFFTKFFKKSVYYLCQISKMRWGTHEYWNITAIYFTDVGVASEWEVSCRKIIWDSLETETPMVKKEASERLLGIDRARGPWAHLVLWTHLDHSHISAADPDNDPRTGKQTLHR